MNDQDRFDRFTERARIVMSLAQEEAQRFQHNYIGTEHLLLGLICEGNGVAAQVLNSLGAGLQKARNAVEFIIGRGDHIVLGEVQITPRAKKVFEFAVDEAQQLNHHYIGTEHLLLGLVREGSGIGAGVLESLGIDLKMVRKATLDMLQEPDQETMQGRPPVTPEAASDPSDATLSSSPPPSSRYRFDKFTERARKVLSLAQAEAQRFQHNYIGTEHLLLGLVREGESVAAKVLSNLGVELHTVRSAIEFIIGRGDHSVSSTIGLTPRAKKVLELAIDEARRFDHHYIGTEHLLLGLVREGEGIAAGVLESLGVTLDRVRIATISVLSGTSGTTTKVSWQEETRSASVIITDQEIAPAPPLQNEDDLTPPPTTGESGVSGAFSMHTRKVLDAAQEEAQRHQQDYIGTEHLLLGLIDEEKGLATLVLDNMGVDRAKMRSAVEFIITHGRSRTIPGGTGLTPRSKKVIQLAVAEASSMSDTLVGTEHLLLGMLREGEGIAAGVLQSLGVTIEKVYRELGRIRH